MIDDIRELFQNLIAPRLEGIQGELKAVNTRIDALESKIDAMDSKFNGKIDAMNAQIVEIKKGQYLTFTNDPAKGVTVDMNGAAGSPIQGPDFAMALLSVWLGPKPPNADLKTGLLGGACE